MEKNYFPKEKQKNNRFFFPSKWWRVVLLVFIFVNIVSNVNCLNPPSTPSGNDYWTFDSYHFNAKWDVYKGNYKFNIIYYNLYGSYDGFVKYPASNSADNNKPQLDVHFLGSDFSLYTTLTINWNDLKNGKDPTITSIDNKISGINRNSEDVYHNVSCSFYFNPTTADIATYNNKNAEASISGNYSVGCGTANSFCNTTFGRWKTPETTSNYSVEKLIDNMSININDVTLNTPEFTSYRFNGIMKPAIKVQWSKTSTGGNADGLGSVTLYLKDESTGTLKKLMDQDAGYFDSSNNPYAYQGGYFYVDLDSLDINKSNKLVAIQHYKPSDYYPDGNPYIQYTKQSNEVTLPAYQQVNSFSSTFDPDTRKVNFSWDIKGTPGTNPVDSAFVITGTDLTPININYSANTSSYQTSKTIPEGVNKDFTYYINRSKNPVWINTYQKTCSVDVNTNHLKILDNPDSTYVKLSKENNSDTIKWTYTGSVWSKGTQFIITRDNLTARTSQDIVLDKEAFLKKMYVDNMIKPCNSYQYKLKLKPNENYKSQSEVLTGSVLPIEIGTVESVTASKGYYSNRVEISWVTKGAFDNFSIKRKEYNQPDNAYKQITLVPGSASQSSYNTEDANAVPGVVYQYQVVGNVNCAGEPKTSLQSPTDIGFRTSTGDIYGRVTFTNGQAVQDVEVRLESETNIQGKSYKLDGLGQLTITNPKLLSAATDSVTIQALIKPESTQNTSYIMQKSGMYELYVKENKINFKVGAQELTSDSLLTKMGNPQQFVQVSAVSSKLVHER